MHDSSSQPDITPEQSSALTSSKLEENDLLRFQLAIAHLGLAKQEEENARLKTELAQLRHDQAKLDLNRVRMFIQQKYGLVDGADILNYASGEISRGGERAGGSGEA